MSAEAWFGDCECYDCFDRASYRGILMTSRVVGFRSGDTLYSKVTVTVTLDGSSREIVYELSQDDFSISATTTDTGDFQDEIDALGALGLELLYDPDETGLDEPTELIPYRYQARLLRWVPPAPVAYENTITVQVVLSEPIDHAAIFAAHAAEFAAEPLEFAATDAAYYESDTNKRYAIFHEFIANGENYRGGRSDTWAENATPGVWTASEEWGSIIHWKVAGVWNEYTPARRKGSYNQLAAATYAGATLGGTDFLLNVRENGDLSAEIDIGYPDWTTVALDRVLQKVWLGRKKEWQRTRTDSATTPALLSCECHLAAPAMIIVEPPETATVDLDAGFWDEITVSETLDAACC